jgi:hypothetical protein
MDNDQDVEAAVDGVRGFLSKENDPARAEQILSALKKIDTGESAREEISSLIDEFADELKRLPSWEKSSHYCLISGLLALSGPHRPWGILLGLALAISQVGEFTGEREHEEEDRHHERHHGKEHEEKH